jgi:hypothetical protein
MNTRLGRSISRFGGFHWQVFQHRSMPTQGQDNDADTDQDHLTPYFEMLGKFFKVLTNNVAVTGANEGPVTIQHLLELLGPLPKGTTKERLAAQDATVVETQAVEASTEIKPTLPDRTISRWRRRISISDADER